MSRAKNEFSLSVEKKVKEQTGNRCERCGIDFDEKFEGEFHHIIPVIYTSESPSANPRILTRFAREYGGSNDIDNCSLLCHHCHSAAPNVKNKLDMLIYKYYFLRFASFKEAAQYYEVDNLFDLSVKFAFELAQMQGGEKKIKNIEDKLR